MEAKRQKELEKEAKQARKAEAELEGRPTWRDEIDSEEEEGTKKKEKNSELGKHESSRSKRSYRQQSPSPQRVSFCTELYGLDHTIWYCREVGPQLLYICMCIDHRPIVGIHSNSVYSLTYTPCILLLFYLLFIDAEI